MAKHAEGVHQPPEPALGGIVIQRCGQLSHHRASASNDSGQRTMPHAVHAETARQPHRLHEPANAEPVQRQRTGEPSLDGPAAGCCEGKDMQRRLVLLWRVKMKDCVDASPVVLMQRHVVAGKVTMR